MSFTERFRKARKIKKKVKKRNWFISSREKEFENLFLHICYSCSTSRFSKMKNGVERELCTSLASTRNRCDIVRAVCATGSLYMVKDSGGGYASVRSSLLCSGKREVGDTEVNAGHRRQQTGLNWREPVSRSSPTIVSRWRGSWRTGKERGKKRQGILQKKDTVHANKFRTPYILCSCRFLLNPFRRVQAVFRPKQS